MSSRVVTIQDRLRSHPALNPYASLLGKTELALYREIKKGRAFTGDLAKTFYQAFGISAKNLEHVHVSLKARMDSERECALLHAAQLRDKIAAKDRDITRCEARIAKAMKALAKIMQRIRPNGGEIAAQRAIRYAVEKALHQHRRRKASLDHRLGVAEARAKDVRLCFGSRSLLAARNRIDGDDAAEIAVWNAEWVRRRGGQIFIPGETRSADGSIFLRVERQECGSWMLVLRLPNALKHFADRTVRAGGRDHHEALIGTVRFPHGAEDFADAIAAHDEDAEHAAPITWLIQRHPKGGWLVSATLRQRIPDVAVSDFRNGALGIDFNAGHLAVILTDSDGNPRRRWRIALVTHSRSSDQNLDACRKAAIDLATIAKAHHVPVVAEALDFSKKKASVTTEQGARYARMLNGLVYAAFCESLGSACARNGVMLRRVNPAYTSIIGQAKFACRHGLSVHSAAACAIARRGQGFSERVPDQVSVLLTAGAHGTLPRPEVRHAGAAPGIAEKAGKGSKPLSSRRHVWASWSSIAQGRKAALTAHVRSLREKRSVGSSGDAGPGASIGRAGVGIPGASPRARGLRGAGGKSPAGTDDQVVYLLPT